MMLADRSGLVNTCFTDIVLLLVWILMTLTFAISIQRMVTILAAHGTPRTLCSSLLRNRLRLALLILVLAYDVMLITFIYSTWTVNLALGWRFVQLLPAFTLLLHSAVEQCFLAIVQGNDVYRRDIACTASFHLGVNFTMLLHLISIRIVVGYRIDSEPSLLLSTMLSLMPFELIYRLNAIVDWRYYHTNDAGNGDDCMDYLCEVFTDEQHRMTTQMVAGRVLCLYPSGEGELHST